MKATFLKKVTLDDNRWDNHYRIESVDGQALNGEELREYAQSHVTSGYAETAGRMCVTFADVQHATGSERALMVLECVRDV